MGLFHKLKKKMDENLWLILISYYEKSDGILEINNKIMNQIISINSGVKQGGLLSPLLFNYFINKLLMKKVEVSLVMLKRRY
jgi:retron-type reverse transcriptase